MHRPTAEERAKKLCREEWPLRHSTFPRSPRMVDRMCRGLSRTIHEAEEVARQEEREACAALAQHWEDLIGIAPNIADVSHQIAAAIRAQTLDPALSAMVVEDKRYPNFDLEIALRALRVIEGLTFEDIIMPPEEKLEEIYRYAHIGGGQCENAHPDWCKELMAAEINLVGLGIISSKEGGPTSCKK